MQVGVGQREMTGDVGFWAKITGAIQDVAGASAEACGLWQLGDSVMHHGARGR